MFKSIARLLLVTAAVAGIAAVAPAVASASPEASPSVEYAYTDCGQWKFGIWDHPGGGGPYYCWGGTITCGEWLDLNHVDYPFGGDWRDRTESIQNKTSATMALENWNSATRRWERLWTAPPYPAAGSWGNLPVAIRNQADRVIRVC